MIKRCGIVSLSIYGWLTFSFVGGQQVYAGDYPANNVSLYSHVTLAEMGADFAKDCWGYTSPSGREYAIMGLSQGPGFIEITDPSNPVIVQIVSTTNQAKDMKVYQNYVYSSSDDGPTNIIDVSQIDDGIVTFVGSFSQGTHNVVMNEDSGYLYLALGGPLLIYDLADPTSPTLVGEWPGETHDAQVITYTDGIYTGREIAFVCAGWTGTFNIVDVTDKNNVFLVGSTSYKSATYTHEGWISDDKQYYYVNDEIDDIQRTIIIDVSNIATPTVEGEFSSSVPTAIDHNLYIRDGFIFEANYTSGLRIFDTCDPLNPVETGFFDTYPANDNTSSQGAWSNYPFFPSGTVIVSDRQGGLFVLDVSDAVIPIADCGVCIFDLDGDGVVATSDLLELFAQWGTAGPADFDGSGAVGTNDLLILFANWGPCP